MRRSTPSCSISSAFYARNLAVPPRRDPRHRDVLAGKRIFHAIGCATCHVPSHVRATARPMRICAARRSGRTPISCCTTWARVSPTGAPKALADGREWRTAPLWGIGLTETVNGHTFFLHDGRARNLTEAILWHGGEAQRARDAFARLSPEDRRRLVPL